MNWVQGMREVTSGASHPLDWREVLYRRLAGDLLAIPSGQKTMEAEEALSLGRNVYYYIGRSVPEFGSHTVAHDPYMTVEGLTFKSSPFDTGGIVADYISLCTPLTSNEKRELVAQQTFSELDYVSPMDSWLDAAFSDRRHYVTGKKPSCSSVAVIDLEHCDPPAWTWEGRIPVNEYTGPPMAPVRVFMKEHEYALYSEWLPYQTFLDEDQAFDHIDMLDSLLEIVECPAESMSEFICLGSD